MDEAADAGAAERAFEALRAEVAALRQAVAGQTTPDYALTLGEMAQTLAALQERLAGIEAKPALGLTAAACSATIRVTTYCCLIQERSRAGQVTSVKVVEIAV